MTLAIYLTILLSEFIHRNLFCSEEFSQGWGAHQKNNPSCKIGGLALVFCVFFVWAPPPLPLPLPPRAVVNTVV
jgi:hypothetical protein